MTPRCHPHLSCLFAGALVLIGALVHPVRAARPDPVLERYLELALSQNPRLAVAQSRAEAARQMLPQESALPDPMLGFGIRELDLKGSPWRSTEMTSRWISLEQEFPFPGTLGRKRARAAAMRDMSVAMAGQERAMLIADVRTMYYEWAYLRAAMDLVRESRTLMEQNLAAAAESYRVGLSSQSDMLRAQTEIARMDNMLAEMQQMERTAVADINICCALPPNVITQVPSPLTYEVVDIPYDTLWAMIQHTSPDLLSAQAQVEAARLNRDLARRMYFPMMRVGAEYMRRGTDMPEDMVSFMGGVSLPMYWTKSQSRMVRQREIELQQSREEQLDVTNRLHARLTDLAAQAASLREQIERYDGSIIPQAAQTFAATRAAYSTGRVDFMTLLSNQMLLLDVQRERAVKTAGYLKVWSQIEALVGQRLF